MTTTLGKSITSNWMMGTEQPPHILLTTTTQIGQSLIIANPLRADTENLTDPTMGHNDQNHFPIGSFNSGIDDPRSVRNIDNRTVMNPQGTNVTTNQNLIA